MEKKKTRRRHLITASLSLLIFFLLSATFHHHPHSLSSSPSTTTTTISNKLQKIDHQHASLDPSRRRRPPTPTSTNDAVLLPNWEVLLLPPHHPISLSSPVSSSCLFQDTAATSPAVFSGILPSSLRPTFLCSLPKTLRRKRTLYSPRLVAADDDVNQPSTELQLLPRWDYLAYESLSTGEDDVIVFAKGVNPRTGVADLPAGDLRCVFFVSGAAVVVKTAVSSSSREVFRCQHPSAADLRRLHDAAAEFGGGVRISLAIRGKNRGKTAGEEKLVPSVAEYRGPLPPPAHDKARNLLCACTMLHNVAKFLREWVMYHHRVGVDRFVLYDNGSDDGLDRLVSALQTDGYDVIALLWPWPKTQEAGFSHCAALHRDSCEWMMYLDVDEFAFSPSWSNSTGPGPSMLKSLLPARSSPVGQITMGCHDFGPSNRTAHPANGVTQGYTCRKRHVERHKSIVRLDAVDASLWNVVHHFNVREGYKKRKVVGRGRNGVVVNHYKYQAWAEFKTKFRRRVSAYVADWTEAVNAGSQDRTPGLGFSAVEPEGWAGRFCEVRDTGLRDLGRRWFGVGVDGSTGEYQMVWQS